MRFPLIALVGGSLLLVPVSSFAQVPVTDASREKTETNTAVCMERARTFKQGTVAPTHNIHSSVTIKGDTGGITSASGQSVIGATLSGSMIGGNDFALLLATANTVQAIKTKNVGQAVAALAAVAAAISANSTSLSAQSGTIGMATTIKGAFEQNAVTRLTNAQVWNQAIQAVATTNQLRNQRLLDLAAAASATAKAMAYDPSKVTLTNPEHPEASK